MSTKPFDFKKAYKDLYLPKDQPVLIEIPTMNFIMVDGQGDPNNNPSFQQAVELLYGLSYTIKMSKMQGNQPEGYFEYVVPPLEGLWWIDEGSFSFDQRANWQWTLMLRQPEFVNQEVFNWAKESLSQKKKELAIATARLATFTEGWCVQMMHIGPYSTEQETIEKIAAFIQQEGLRDMLGLGGKHHELYISDPMKSKPESMKTVLRHPVEVNTHPGG